MGCIYEFEQVKWEPVAEIEYIGMNYDLMFIYMIDILCYLIISYLYRSALSESVMTKYSMKLIDTSFSLIWNQQAVCRLTEQCVSYKYMALVLFQVGSIEVCWFEDQI